MEQKKVFTFIAGVYLLAIIIANILPLQNIEIVARYDKYFHLVEFFYLTVLLFRLAELYGAKYPGAVAMLVTLGLTVLTEIMQLFTPHRNFSFPDMAFNVSGMIIGLSAAWILGSSKKQAK